MIRWLAVIILLVPLGGCPPSEGPTPPPNPPPEPPGTHEDCEAACKHLVELHCDEQWQGADCVEACWAIESSGDFTICPRRIVKATSCKAADVASQCGRD